MKGTPLPGVAAASLAEDLADGLAEKLDIDDAPIDPAANVPGLRTLGTGAQQAAVGSHIHGGEAGEPIPVDDDVDVPSLRTLGTGPLQAAPGSALAGKADLDPETGFVDAEQLPDLATLADLTAEIVAREAAIETLTGVLTDALSRTVTYPELEDWAVGSRVVLKRAVGGWEWDPFTAGADIDNALLTEAGDYLVTETGDYLVLEGA